MKAISINKLTLQFDSQSDMITPKEQATLTLMLINEILSTHFTSLQPQILISNDSEIKEINIVDF